MRKSKFTVNTVLRTSRRLRAFAAGFKNRQHWRTPTNEKNACLLMVTSATKDRMQARTVEPLITTGISFWQTLTASSCLAAKFSPTFWKRRWPETYWVFCVSWKKWVSANHFCDFCVTFKICRRQKNLCNMWNLCDMPFWARSAKKKSVWPKKMSEANKISALSALSARN